MTKQHAGVEELLRIPHHGLDIVSVSLPELVDGLAVLLEEQANVVAPVEFASLLDQVDYAAEPRLIVLVARRFADPRSPQPPEMPVESVALVTLGVCQHDVNRSIANERCEGEYELAVPAARTPGAPVVFGVLVDAACMHHIVDTIQPLAGGGRLVILHILHELPEQRRVSFEELPFLGVFVLLAPVAPSLAYVASRLFLRCRSTRPSPRECQP